MQQFQNLQSLLNYLQQAGLGDFGNGTPWEYHVVAGTLTKLVNSSPPSSIQLLDPETPEDLDALAELPTCSVDLAGWSLGDLGYGSISTDHPLGPVQHRVVAISVGGSALSSAATLAVLLSWE